MPTIDLQDRHGIAVDATKDLASVCIRVRRECTLMKNCSISGDAALTHDGGHAEIFKKFADSAWGKKLAKREVKSHQTDFERYKAAVERKKRSEAIKKELKA